MKKTILLGALLFASAAAYAQESRQDVSISGLDLVGPTVHGTGNTLYPSNTGGVLISYRYLLTPHSALEGNYSFLQNTNYYNIPSAFSNPKSNPAVHTRQQEGTVGYVYGLTFKNFNPFVEAGIGGVFFTPIQEGTTSLDTTSNTRIAAMIGGGLAYEISPSFDIRLQYHGLIYKAPELFPIGKLNRYELSSLPAIGIAYHF
jgi:opacity protein-like surface antigen